MSHLKVIDNRHLVRDTESGALINKDHDGLQEYFKKRKVLMSQSEELNKVKTELDSIKHDMCEIKQLMYKLLDKSSNG
jgi:hypothetical protein